MTENIIIQVLYVTGIIMVAIITGISNHRAKMVEVRTRKVGQARVKRETAQIQKNEAVEALTYLTAKKVHGDETNGDLKNAIDLYRWKRDDCNKAIKESLDEMEEAYR
jgi:hypothetical protein